MQNTLKNRFNLNYFKLVVVVSLFNLILPQLSQGQTNNLELPTSINDNGSEPHPSAIVDINSSTQGVLFPRMKFSEILKIENPAEGLMVFDVEFKCLRMYLNNCWECMYQTQNKKTAPGQFIVKSLDEPNSDNDINFIELETDDAGNFYALVDKDDFDDYVIVKQNFAGNVEWKIKDVAYEDFDCIELDVNQNLYVVGTVGSDTTFIRKYNTNGTLVWNTNLIIKGIYPNIQSLYINEIKLNNNGEIAIGGVFNENFTINNIPITNYGNDDVFVMKLTDNGNAASVNWVKTYGDANYDYFVNLEIDNFGNVYTMSNKHPTYGLIDDNKIITKKWSTNGTALWSKTIASDDEVYVRNFGLTPANELVFVAYVKQSYISPDGIKIDLGSSNQQMLIGKFDTNGNYKIDETTYFIAENYKPISSLERDITEFKIGTDGFLYMIPYATIFNGTFFKQQSKLLTKISYNGKPKVEWVYPLNISDSSLSLNISNQVFIGGTYFNPATVGSQIIEDPDLTGDYFHILQYIE